ncbi:MAG: hypothetical protein U0R18_15475 [Mycobacterium sp.]
MAPTAQLTDAERIAVARAYIDALVSHHGDDVAFAPGCTRVENGLKTGFSGDHLRRSLNRGPQFRLIKSVEVRQATVTGDEVRVLFDLATKPAVAGVGIGAHVDETFTIPATDGLIHHIRATIRPRITR